MTCQPVALVPALVSLLFACSATSAQISPPAAAAPVWAALSTPSVDATKSAHVENVIISRDRVQITLIDGTIQFTQPANDVVFGAIFHGRGRVQADPPNAIEAQQLRLFTKQDKLDMPFSDATFSFTDTFFDEVGKQVKWQPSGPTSDALYVTRQKAREDLGAEYLPRLFKGVMSPDKKRTAYFLADLKTADKGWIEVRDDAMQPEEIRVGRWVSDAVSKNLDIWMNFPAGDRDFRHAYDDPAAREDFLLPAYHMDVTLADNADVRATTRATVHPRYSGERVLLFELDANLRLSAVKDQQGRALEYFQARERKDRYQSYGDYVVVVLPEAAQAEQDQDVEFQYGGKRVVIKVGGGNYFCESFGWYPSLFSNEPGVETFAFRSSFDMTFHNPKKYSLAATGNKTSESTAGNQLITTWKTDLPLAAAGFVFGDYKIISQKVGDVDVQVFANRQPDDLLASIQQAFDNPINDLAMGAGGPGDFGGHNTNVAIGTLSAAALGKTISIETANTLNVFQNYFGPYPYKQLVVTNIIGSYGQGWPGLLYLGWFTFLDATQRHALGIKDQVNVTSFFRGHESSHQWWGHRVGWKSYHDQWLSEGFAEFSGQLYVQFREGQKEFYTQLRKDKELLRTADIHNHQVESLGPIYLGRRIASSETGRMSYQNLIYSKGGYVLEMLRQQLADARDGDADHLFKDMMRDYCKTFNNKPASTEDFKSIVEKHMTRSMDLDGNHKMDWFFNQYVYGTGMAQYSFHATTEGTPDGKTHVKATVQRTGVPDNWKDSVAIYAHVGDKTTRIGTLAVTHASEPIDAVLPGKIDRVTINDHEDLLAEVKQ
jgi:hypothetical protein